MIQLSPAYEYLSFKVCEKHEYLLFSFVFQTSRSADATEPENRTFGAVNFVSI